MSGRPLHVIRAHHSAPVDPIAYPQVKIIVITAGWTRLEHRGRMISLEEGDVAILPTQALVSGNPLPVAETVTFYLDPLFLEQQTSWVHTSTQVRNAFRTAAAGTGPLLSLRPPEIGRRTLITRLHASCSSPTAHSFPSTCAPSKNRFVQPVIPPQIL